MCEAAASDQAALKTQSLTTNTPPSPPTTSTITVTTTTTTTTTTTVTTTIPTSTVTESSELGPSTSGADDRPVSVNCPDTGNPSEGTAVKNVPPVENKAVRVLLAPLDNSHNRSQNILFRNVVIANNPNIVNSNHNFTIHHHFAGAATPNQYVQNEPILIAGQAQPQQGNGFNVQNILGQSNHNVIQFPNYTRFPSQLHLDISNRAPNVTIRAFETGGLSHLTRSQFSNHGQAFIHRPMTLTLPQNQRNSQFSEIKILHSAPNVLHTAPQVVQSPALDTSNIPVKSEEPEKVIPVDTTDGSRVVDQSKETEAGQSVGSEQTTGHPDDRSMVGFNRLLIVSDHTSQQTKLPQKDGDKTESSEPNDHQIRVLTPSEIMRTLPSLGPDGYDLVHPSQTTSPAPSNHSHMVSTFKKRFAISFSFVFIY